MTTARGTGFLGGILGGLGTVVLAGALAYAPASEANVYKWRDPAGIVHYTDKPPPADGVLISIEQSGYSKRNDAPPQASTPRVTPSSSESPNLSADAKLRNAVQNDVAAAQTEQCKQAKERYTNYVQSRRLYKEGPNKERVYLSEQELEQARLNARREMDEACGAGSQ